MQLKHRAARPCDLNAVFNLYMDPAANDFLTFDPMTISAFSPIYNSLLNDNNLFIVELENEIIATYRLIRKTHRQSHIFYIGGFTVKSSHKGRGHGFAILNHIKHDATKQSIKRIELTVDTENNSAINLYRKIGFEIEGKLKNNYRLSSTGKFYDEYLMALLID
jgi:RimJ/RimL family protein N-acetyltransferase